MLPILLLCLLVSSSHAADFCVADLTGPETPSGYQCKKESAVTADDFVITGLGVPGNFSTMFKAAPKTAFVAQFPGLNGLGISAAYVYYAPGGFIPVHSHPAGTELLVVTEGTLLAGFISSANNPYYKTLNKGDAMVFPQGLLHFQVNVGETTAVGVVGFSSPSPGIQVTSPALFSNNLPSAVVEKVTYLDDAEVKKLKKMLGGTG
ncbi:germin-like protein 8-14 [Phoenix dactylifera]|uniref:Germin-like protein n=1 Tax=Phoenix dactylifera TaxID=42345 RepID=A0A8B7BW45_PHODC|nr:germin-like protein 8-14 [Phoenix dactylifera]